MPAAAVTPAPIAYIKIAAVKKLVVGYLVRMPGPPPSGSVCAGATGPSFRESALACVFGCEPARDRGSFTLKKLECSKQAFAVNTLAWNNEIGLRDYFVGF